MLNSTIENDLSKTPLGEIFDGSAALDTHPLPSASVKKVPWRQKRRIRHREGTVSLFPDKNTEDDDSIEVLPFVIKDGDSMLDAVLTDEKTVPVSSSDNEDTPVSKTPEIKYSEVSTVAPDAGAGKKEDESIRLLSDSGVIYETAEKLYLREKTASELEALFDPPFRKNLAPEELIELDRQSEENARSIAAGKNLSAFGKRQGFSKPITTTTAFILQSVMLVPVLNIIVSLFFAFSKNGSPNMKAYCRGFLIWASIIMTSALVFFAWSYFSVSSNRPQLFEFLSR